MNIAVTPHLDAPSLSGRRFVLATDLDGTFLGGSERDRLTLYRWIEENRDQIGLIFVTGRDPEFLERLCAETPAPWPDYVVGDVGTTIAAIAKDRTGARRVAPIPDLEAEIAAIWNNAGPSVRAALVRAPGLSLQPTAFRHRVSYDLDLGVFDGAAFDIVERLGHDSLVSADRYFDVLPRGVSKGPSLRRLLRFLDVEETRVLAAGDTLNDLSMLKCGVPAVAVGGSEPALLAALDETPGLHRARAVGAGGILEAIAALDLHPTPPKPEIHAR